MGVGTARTEERKASRKTLESFELMLMRLAKTGKLEG